MTNNELRKFLLLLSKTSSPPPPAWLPTDIGGCKRWGQSDSLITKDEADRASIYGDKTGNGNDYTQDTDSKKFVWTANQIDGYPALIGDGIDDVMNGNSLAPLVNGLNSFTYFGVIKEVNIIPWDYPQPWFFQTNGPVQYWAPPETCLFWVGGVQIRLYRRDGVKNFYVLGSYTPGNWGYWILTASPTNVTLRINGSTIIDNVAWAIPNIDLGTGVNTFQIRSILEKLYIAEDAFYDNVISGSDILLLESYAHVRYPSI